MYQECSVSPTVADDQLQDLISAPDAWQIADDDTEDNGPAERRTLSVNSARRVKTLIEQVAGKQAMLQNPELLLTRTLADRYSPLPSQKHRLRFFLSIQLDVLEQYLSRISSSLDAFETLSSALVRAVPGALSSIAMGDSSVNVETQRLTTGIEGAQRLCKALLASKYIQTALQGWGDSMVSVNILSDLLLCLITCLLDISRALERDQFTAGYAVISAVLPLDTTTN